MVMGYAKKSFVELMDWLYVRHGHITPVEIKRKQEKTQATYNYEDPIEILFDQIETGQEFTVAGNSPFSDQQLACMGIAKILAMQEYAHAYRMWKSIAADDSTWVRSKAHFQETYMEREDMEQTARVAGYVRPNNAKHGEMEDEFTNLLSATSARDSDFTGNLYKTICQQEDQILALQAKLCNLKVEAATRPVKVKYNNTGQPYVRYNKQIQ